MALAGSFGQTLVGAWNLVVGKRGRDSSEGRLDGRPTRRRKTSKEDECRHPSSPPTKPSSMTGTGSGQRQPFDLEFHSRYFTDGEDKTARSVNPLAVCLHLQRQVFFTISAMH